MKLILKLENLILRPYRLAMLLIVTAFAFAWGRLVLFIILGLLLFIAAVKTYFVEKKSYFGLLIPVFGLGLILGIYFIKDYYHVRNYVIDHSPINLNLVYDGTYQGTGMGLRGPIKVQTSIDDGMITDIQILQHQEAISALEGLNEQVLERNSLDIDVVPATVHGSIEATAGYLEALNNALWKGVPEKPQFSAVTKFIHYFAQFQFNLTTFNALAILFCIILVFDYTLQSVLVKNTGQALNCYNCQTCVGVCPVKIVDEEPYPMTMILAARLGDYEKVKYLSKYCVACSRCAGKCPVGVSGPSIAAAANAELIRQKQRQHALSQG
ncbi:MAG TPA: hypothetical protein ENN22_15060 [bacterium]|nr:hypothetical protein [bacterium]